MSCLDNLLLPQPPALSPCLHLLPPSFLMKRILFHNPRANLCRLLGANSWRIAYLSRLQLRGRARRWEVNEGPC